MVGQELKAIDDRCAVRVSDSLDCPTGVDGLRADQPSNDEIDGRMSKITEILNHATMHLLEKCGLIAEWVHHAETKVSVFGQVVQKTGGGRPEGGVARAARELPVPGKTVEARRKFIERAMKIDGIWLEAKSAARAAGLDDIQSALLDIAGEKSREAQLTKVSELADCKATRRRKRGKGDQAAMVSDAGQLTRLLDVSEVGALAAQPLTAAEQEQLALLQAAWTDNGVLRRAEWEKATAVLHRHFAIHCLDLGDTSPTGIEGNVFPSGSDAPIAPEQADVGDVKAENGINPKRVRSAGVQ